MHLDSTTIIQALDQKGYVFFEGVTRDQQLKPFDLNIIGIRSSSRTPNEFDDALVVLCYDDYRNEIFRQYPITTDPGLYWLENPIHVNGTAILCPGQYRNAYTIGRHRNYVALEQVGAMEFIRDADRDQELDFDSPNREWGIIKANIHKANPTGRSTQVDKWSAGCQVFADSKDFDEFMRLCDSGRVVWGNGFSYTLLTEDDL